jgi:hypothetical protein
VLVHPGAVQVVVVQVDLVHHLSKGRVSQQVRLQEHTPWKIK